MNALGVVTFIGFLMLSMDIQADIYKYVDTDGRVFYTDKPPHKKYRNVFQDKTKRNTAALRLLWRNKKRYTGIIAAAAHKYRLDADLIHAVIRAESAYNAKAVSKAGAVGLMQLMPATAKRYGVSDRKNAKQNIDGGTHYIKDLFKMFNSNLKLVVASYNAGEGAVKKYHNAIPPYPETRDYVRKVLRLYRKL